MGLLVEEYLLVNVTGIPQEGNGLGTISQTVWSWNLLFFRAFWDQDSAEHNLGITVVATGSGTSVCVRSLSPLLPSRPPDAAQHPTMLFNISTLNSPERKIPFFLYRRPWKLQIWVFKSHLCLRGPTSRVFMCSSGVTCSPCYKPISKTIA